jgi:putative redox protein
MAVMAKTTVHLTTGYRTENVSRNLLWHTDEPVDAGGTDTAPTPMETLLGAVGGCVAITMKMYAARKGWALEKIEVELEHQRFKKEEYLRYEGDQPFVHEIIKRVTLHGDLNAEQRERLMEIGTKCPVSRLLIEPKVIIDELIEAEKLSK